MDSEKFLTNLYCGMDEDEAIRIAKEKSLHFRNTVVKAVGGGVLYHSGYNRQKEQEMQSRMIVQAITWPSRRRKLDGQ